ncbi:DUF6077 domain-containing protein [Catellatospora bangladeshensis]|uniref:Uncharacterized protein n=1 Tax=Catellatospora bangladeshensis TaxID=310355 RepID=A0A8J3JR87_9ACTN|nr:DUF6077 domain-containing protein [Catellatospora bangladeshensis]GIF83655.1 hypothetical protein Cba03nite_50040 [Catellatospora bangladeshensis]
MRERLGRLLAGAPVALTDAAVISFAGWTVLYHLGFFVSARPSILFYTWLVLTVAGTAFSLRRRAAAAAAPVAADAPAAEQPSETGAASRRPLLLKVALLAAAGAAVLVAYLTSGWSWWLAIALGLVACAATLTATGFSPRPAAPSTTTPLQGALVLVASLGMAAIALVLNRNSQDDVFYVGKSVWIAEHDLIPLRDFLFTDQVLPGLSSQPPISSFEAFAGAIGAATGLHASSATWFVLLPVLAIVASLALWRLAHRWAPRRPLLVFGIGLAYLLLVAGEDAALGTFHLRLAEGKGMFVSAMIPLAWVYLTDLVEHRTRRSLWLLVALSIASVGLSTVSVMLLPVMAGAAWVILLLMRRPRDAFASALALTVYPVAVTVAFRLWMGGMTEEMATLQFYDARGTLARTVLVGVIGLISAFALWAGALFVRDGVPRLLTAGAVTTLTVLLIPGVIETIHGFTGLGPVLWRLPWIVPFPVLIGMYVALPWERWLRLESRGGLAPRAIPVAVAAALVGALAFAGTPMWSSKSHVFVDRATALRIPVPAWKIPVGRKIAAFWIRDLDRPAGYLLAPSIVMRAMPMVTSRVPVVMARDGYLIEYGWESEFALDRRKLSAWADGNSDASAADLTAAMKRVGVGTVCVWDSNDKAIAMAPQLGLTELASRPDPNGMVCYTANPAA